MRNAIEDRLARMEEKIDALQFSLKKEVMRLEIEDKISSDYFDRALDLFEKLNEEMSDRRETTNRIQERLETEIARIDGEKKGLWEQLKLQLDIHVAVKDDQAQLHQALRQMDEKLRGYVRDIAGDVIRENERLNLHSDQIKLMLMRLDDIYYHVFPGRLRQDVQVLDQIEALSPKRNTDGGAKKDG